MTSRDLEEDADQELSNYRQKLVQLDSELDSDNVKCLKYLCFDVIPASKLEKITQGTDLFELLEQKGFLGNGNYFFLAECLSKIGRRDLSEVALDHNVLNTTIENSGPQLPAHRSLWFDISEDLDAEEVCKCLYYYGDVPKSKRGGIKSGIDFLNFLEKKKKIGPDNMDYLLDVLKTIERNDLVQMIQKYTGRIPRQVPFRPIYRPPQPTMAAQQSNDELESFKAREKEKMPPDDDFDSWKEREMESIPPDDVDLWVGLGRERISGDFIAGPPPKSIGPQSYSMTSPLDIPMPMQIQLAYQIFKEPEKIPEFGKALGLSSNEIDGIMTNNAKRLDMIALEMMRLWSQQTQTEGNQNKINDLIDALMKSGFEKLSVELKNEFLRLNDGAVTEPNVNNPTPQNTLPELPVSGPGNNNNLVPSHTDEHKNIYISSGEAQALNPGEDGNYVRQMSEAIVDVEPPAPLLEMYRMDRYPRGMCVIFNNENFTYDSKNHLAKKMNNRVGSAIDRDTLDRTFTELGFQVYVHNDLKAVEMVQILTRYSLEDHELFDCFVCVILSHGTRDYIYGANCEPVPIRTLADPLKNLSCPGLCGKPKLFFIQACQGQDKQHGRDIERDVVRVDDLDEDAPPNGEVIPNEQDFLIGMATIPGFVSYRSKTSGSWFIIKLCEALQKFAKYWDILHILTYVNSEVGKANADIDGVRYKQSPGPLYTLRKRLLFQPIVRSSD